jgi:alkylated DNA repair dioxygenase AlkB
MQTSLDFEGRPHELLAHDGSAILYKDATESKRAAELYETLTNDLAWAERKVRVFGRWVAQPRLTTWYGEPDRPYQYSGIELQPLPWTAELAWLRDICEHLAKARFNSVLANLYRTGADSVSWHGDDEPELGENPVIASVSLGGTRRFDLRHRETGETVKTLLTPGSVLVMSGQTQHKWLHQLPKTTQHVEPRINLTYRYIHG